ncbi:MAG: tRNA (adenosine(37)-N6)-dimethylallyltransferase MiaA [Bacteroidota bacterium]
MENKKYLISIVGPTAVGKTAMAIQLAKHFNTVIISADSRQFYKEISIGTAKPSLEELNQVTHYFINNKSVTETYSAGDFEKDALLNLQELFKENDTVILVGGSGLYIKALWDGLDDLPKENIALRNELHNEFKTNGIEYLQNRLFKTNPEKLVSLDVMNPQRLMRAIEIAELSNSTVFTPQKAIRPFQNIKIGLNKEREILYNDINNRVDGMIASGLINECEKMSLLRDKYALKTVGYTEIFDYFDNKHSLQKAIELIKQHTRNYAKRQITWFKREEDLEWFEPNETEKIIGFVNKKLGKKV